MGSEVRGQGLTLKSFRKLHAFDHLLRHVQRTQPLQPLLPKQLEEEKGGGEETRGERRRDGEVLIRFLESLAPDGHTLPPGGRPASATMLQIIHRDL